MNTLFLYTLFTLVPQPGYAKHADSSIVQNSVHNSINNQGIQNMNEYLNAMYAHACTSN